MSCLHALPSFRVHLCVLLCMSLKKGTSFGAMVIHSGTLCGTTMCPQAIKALPHHVVTIDCSFLGSRFFHLIRFFG